MNLIMRNKRRNYHKCSGLYWKLFIFYSGNSDSAAPENPTVSALPNDEAAEPEDSAAVETPKNAEFDGILEYGAESISPTARNLLNPDEIIRMNNDEQIVMIRGQKPFKCKKLRYWEYRLGKDIKQTMIEDYTPPNITTEFEKYEEEKLEEKLPTFEEFLKGRR